MTAQPIKKVDIEIRLHLLVACDFGRYEWIMAWMHLFLKVFIQLTLICLLILLKSCYSLRAVASYSKLITVVSERNRKRGKNAHKWYVTWIPVMKTWAWRELTFNVALLHIGVNTLYIKYGKKNSWKECWKGVKLIFTKILKKKKWMNRNTFPVFSCLLSHFKRPWRRNSRST